MNNPFALVVIVAQQEALCEKLEDEARQTTRMKIVDAMKASGQYNEVQIKEFVRFLNKIIIVKDLKYDIIFDKHLQNLTGGRVTMGITETLNMLERQEGIEIGIEKGVEIGRHAEALDIARNFKNLGVAIADIAKGTGLTIEEIEKL